MGETIGKLYLFNLIHRCRISLSTVGFCFWFAVHSWNCSRWKNIPLPLQLGEQTPSGLRTCCFKFLYGYRNFNSNCQGPQGDYESTHTFWFHPCPRFERGSPESISVLHWFCFFLGGNFIFSGFSNICWAFCVISLGQGLKLQHFLPHLLYCQRRFGGRKNAAAEGVHESLQDFGVAWQKRAQVVGMIWGYHHFRKPPYALMWFWYGFYFLYYMFF